MTTYWVPISVAAGSLVDDSRLSGEHPLDMIEAGFTAGASWTRTVAGTREVDLTGFEAVTVTTRGEPRPVRDDANFKAAELYREKRAVDDLAATVVSDDARAELSIRSAKLQSQIDQLYARSV